MFSADRPFVDFWFVDNYNIVKCSKAVNIPGTSSIRVDLPLAEGCYIFRNASNRYMSTAGQNSALKIPSTTAHSVVACWR